jgi:5-formyltetrahydrofolate cyclo-ligase
VKKSLIRKKLLKKREENYLKNNQINIRPIIKILKKRKFKNKILGGYYPYNYEIDIMPLVEKFQKLNYSITLPKIGMNSEMNFFQWSTKDPLSINKFGIPEPISNKTKFPDILLVPLLAFDKNFNRIGYGGGFYDRYINRLKKIKKIITIGVAYSFQKIKKIPVEKYDIKLDFVVTEKDS